MEGSEKRRPIIAGIGEILWDVIGDSEKLGGAPINFAFHSAQLGAEAYAISSIGADNRGEEALRILRNSGMTTAHITRIEGAPTGYVTAQIDDRGVATYDFPDNVAWDRIRIEAATLALAVRLDAVCFGSLAQRSPTSKKAIQDYLAAVRPDALKIFDLNIRQNFYSRELIRSSLEQADVLKLNDDEIEIVAEMEGLHGQAEEKLQQLIILYGLKLAALTRGGKGSLLVSRESVSDHPGVKTEILDTIGAGDSFTAVTALGMLRGYPLAMINDQANRVAAFVCSRKGAMVTLPEELSRFNT